jgi:F-type H+-transporting ATPase subunit c
MLSLTVILQVAEIIDWPSAISKVGAALAASICLLGASYGISRLGVTALEAIARQPEAAGDVRSNLIVAAALIEGVAFFAIVVCLLVLFL